MDSCFVIMPIGNQKYDDVEISAAELKNKYDNLIKEAILIARPKLEIVRSDDISLAGTITTDIFTRIMHSKYVVADVTYPNPNVFYELGLRHACRPGTFILRAKEGPKIPFDISHLRFIEYEDTSTGLKELSEKLKKYFDAYESNIERPDNHLLELAKLTKYVFQNYSDEIDQPAPETKLFMSVLKSPELIDMMLRQQNGEKINPAEILAIMASNPEIAEPMISSLVESGQIHLKPDNPKQIANTRRTVAPPSKKRH